MTTNVVMLEHTLARSGLENSLQILLVSYFIGVLGSTRSCASYHLFRGSELTSIHRGIYSSPTTRVAMLQQTLVRSFREDFQQILLRSDLVGVFSRREFCGSLRFFAAPILQVLAPENFCGKLENEI